MILNYYEPMIQKPITKGAENMENTEKFYTPKEVAEILKLSDYTIGDYIRSGKLKAIKFGRVWRISENQLKQFLESKQTS